MRMKIYVAKDYATARNYLLDNGITFTPRTDRIATPASATTIRGYNVADIVIINGADKLDPELKLNVDLISSRSEGSTVKQVSY